jgi:paraquat-inducible protein B
VAGGIAFATPATGPDLPPAEPNTVFTLYPDRTEAFKLPARDPQTYLLVFTQAVRGLAVGAPVEFHGIPIGEVVEVRAQFDARTYEFSAPVIIRVDPESLGVEMLGMDASEDSTAVHHRVMDALIAHGARAQLRTGSLVTGALYVALDYMPDASAATVDWSKTPPQLPTVPSQFEAVEASLVNVVKKLEQVPFQEIGQDLRKTIADLDRTIVSVGRTVDNADKLIEPNSPLSAELSNTLGEMTRAAQALRVLADYLERHPEALIRGKTGESK